jgi:hypothetical protein
MSRCWSVLDGIVNVDEIDCSARGFKGMSTFDLAGRLGPSIG